MPVLQSLFLWKHRNVYSQCARAQTCFISVACWPYHALTHGCHQSRPKDMCLVCIVMWRIYIRGEHDLSFSSCCPLKPVDEVITVCSLVLENSRVHIYLTLIHTVEDGANLESRQITVPKIAGQEKEIKIQVYTYLNYTSKREGIILFSLNQVVI